MKGAPDDIPNYNDWMCLDNALTWAARANAGWGKDATRQINKSNKKFIEYGFYFNSPNWRI